MASNRSNRSGTLRANSNPVFIEDGSQYISVELSWTAVGTDIVEIRVDAPDGSILTRGGPTGSVTTGKWVENGTTFFLQDASKDGLQTKENTMSSEIILLVNGSSAISRRQDTLSSQILRETLKSKGLILMYHHVGHFDTDPYSLSVTPEHFAEHLEVIKELGNPISLRELVEDLENGEILNASIVTTFDDGYSDILYKAEPILKRYSIPAIIFIASACIDSSREFWWDELEKILLHPGILPQELKLNIEGLDYNLNLGKWCRYDEYDFARYRKWKVTDNYYPSARHSLFRAIYKLISPLPEDKRRNVMDAIFRWCGADYIARQSHRILTENEICSLSKGLIEFGGHTNIHPILTSLSSDEQYQEIIKCKAYLDRIQSKPITNFAYPYGDYTIETISAVKGAGFESACTTFPGFVDQHTDKYQLPRFEVRDWSGDDFKRHLANWLVIS
jgi:peptidoglycan/xylan/chitin deacetylase (PgdA/CDA1 family)